MDQTGEAPPPQEEENDSDSYGEEEFEGMGPGFPSDLDSQVPLALRQWEVELPEAVLHMALSPRGKLVAVATAEDEILVVDVDSGEIKFRLAGHRGGTNAVAFLSGATLASCGEDGRARIWNIPRGSCLVELLIEGVDADRSPFGHSVPHLAVPPGAAPASFAVASGKTVKLFTVSGGSASFGSPVCRLFDPLPSTVESMRFDSNGNLLCSYNGGVTAWNLVSRMQEEKQAMDLPYEGACLCVDMSPNQDWVVAGCHDGAVHIWQLVTVQEQGVQLTELTCGGYESKVTLVDFSPSGRWLASAGGSRNTVWDFSESPAGSVPTVTVGHLKPISAQAWGSPLAGTEWLLTGCRGGRVLVYDPAAAEEQTTAPKMCLPGASAHSPEDEVTALAWGGDGWFFTGHVSGFLRAWQLPRAEGNSEEDEEEGDPGPEEE